jgi:hypothetical protein
VPAKVRARFHVFLALAVFACLTEGRGASSPAIFQSGRGRFEIGANDATVARIVADAAGEAWPMLAEPLGLPDEFATPIVVRVIPRQDWTDMADFRVIAEPGGLVSLRLAWDDSAPGPALRRGIVHALLVRLIVAKRGASGTIRVPAWLESGCVGWWQTHRDPAQLDAARQTAAKDIPPRIGELLRSDAAAGTAEENAAFWLFAFLQNESRAGEWADFLGRTLAGQDGVAALDAAYPNRFRDAAERELWWQTGWHQLRREHTLPLLEAAESRAELSALVRFVFSDNDRDRVVPLREVLAHSSEAPIQSELSRRAMLLQRVLPSLHPFYRNAGISLAKILGEGTPRTEEFARFEADWRDGIELEQAAREALDALERK